MKPAAFLGRLLLALSLLFAAPAAWAATLLPNGEQVFLDDNGNPLSGEMPHWGTSGFSQDHGKLPTKSEVEAIQKYLQVLN